MNIVLIYLESMTNYILLFIINIFENKKKPILIL